MCSLFVMALMIITSIPPSQAFCTGRSNRSTFLWSVDDPLSGSRAYLFGTIHVPYTAVWDQISPRVKEAFDRADSVAFEVDLHDEITMRRLVRCKNLRKRQNVQSYLPTSIYKRLHKVMNSFYERIYSALAGKNSGEELDKVRRQAQRLHESITENWNRKRPEWLLLLLYQLCENLSERLGSAPILDLFLAERANADGKTMHSIESVEEQCNPISSVSQEQVLFAINYTLSYLEKPEKHVAARRKERTLTDIVRDYRCGQVEHTMKSTRDLTPVIDPEMDRREQLIEDQLKDDILVTRNERMARRIASLMQAKPHSRMFAAVGTGHFFGPRNILDHLDRIGYVVNPVAENDVVRYSHARREHRVNSLWVRSSNEMDVIIELAELPPNASIDRALTVLTALTVIALM
ncbi:hypothetical protein PENTCL1PPCAC_28918 [Pristionchus entomophagus]|uniref:Metalloprotease TIKI homolog n=1 Tax=Pristionchus entomophagus TaxID=358040 RepID=A0AAV5ULD0_9BILA|nr:hypothetical protein PENTCL1PPCAC_28918 [Pristionchus entomophagus]